MPATGYIQVRAYTSEAQYPLEDVAIVVTAPDGTAIAMALTNRSGRIDPIEIPVPDRSESQTPDPPEKPYTLVNLFAHRQGYEQIEAENLQVFAGTTTVQNLRMIPLSVMCSTVTCACRRRQYAMMTSVPFSDLFYNRKRAAAK